MTRTAGNIPIRVIRSRRKTLSMQVKQEELIVKAPVNTSEEKIRSFINEHAEWIEKQLRRQADVKDQAQTAGHLTMDEIRALADQALSYIPERVRYYAPLIGVTYGRITIRNQRSKWGSCSAKGNLNFNCLLMLTPPQVIDSVVVHELCHRLEMNHSPRFYEHVRRVFPEYDIWNSWLKKNGAVLMQRMKGT